MSSLASAPRGATSGSAGATPVNRVRRFGSTADALLALTLTAALAAVVFVGTGGTDLAPNTWIEIATIAVGAGCAAAVVLVAPRGPAWGAVTVGLFAALAALSYASIAWSVQPADSWVEANRTLAYLAAFGGAAALARWAPPRWPAVVGAIGAATVVVCGYALLTKVFPASLNASDPLGRLRAPFDYWNATGLMAALGLPVCLWAGTRPGGRLLRTLAVPAGAILLTTLVLSYSRGALLAAAIGLAVWFVLVPRRLRGTLVLALAVVGGVLASGWALAHHAISHDNATLAARTSAGHTFGWVLLAVLVLSAALGLVGAQATERVALGSRTRRRIGTALVTLLAMVPVAAAVGAAASSRGLSGQISHVWHTLTSTAPSAGVGNNPGRIAQLSNSRPLYWSEGLKVGEHAPLVGVGAAGFDTAHTRYTSNPLVVHHAHSFVIETFADFGVLGLALTLALLVAWGLACARTLKGSADPARDGDEHAGLVTLLAVAVTFGVSSSIDWTWFVPGVTVPALVAAGWIVGRGPGAVALPGRAAALPARPARPLPLGRAATALGIAAAVLVAGWFVWQPLHSSDQIGAALTAITDHDAPAALADARSAADADPVSVDPLWELSAIDQAIGNQAAARQELVKATQVQPSNPETWQQLGQFDLQQGHDPRAALSELQTAQRLDHTSTITAQLVAQARSEL